MKTGSSFPPMSYADWIRRHAITRSGIIAIATPLAKLSYGDFHRALHRSAYRFAESGIEAGQTVGICILNQALHCLVMAVLNRMGCVPVSLTKAGTGGSGVVIPDGLTVDRVIVEDPFQGTRPERAIGVDLEWLRGNDDEKIIEWNKPGLPDGDATSHIFTSSGTTGALKAVGYSTRQIEARIWKRSMGIFGVSRNGRALCQFGFRSTIGFSTVFQSLWSGGTIFLGYADSVIAPLIARHKIERIEASPAQFQGLLEAGNLSEHDLSSLRFVVTSGSATSQKLAASIKEKICRVLIGHYGATELGMISYGPLSVRGPRGDCGHLVPWMQAEAVDQDGNVLPFGEEGLLRFRCEEMASGYLNDAAASGQFFRDGWFYPGDVGTISETRALTLSGRTSDRINAGGVKVAPDIIENVVSSFEGIEDCAAFGVPDEMGVDVIWAAIVVNSKADLSALRSYCVKKLGVRAPRHFIKIAELPRNDMGKVLRKSLPEIAMRTTQRTAPQKTTHEFPGCGS